MIKIRAVHLPKEACEKLKDLIKHSLSLSQLLNRIASSDYKTLSSEYEEWDAENGSQALPDPLRNALKMQKFYALGSGGLLHSAAHAASNALVPQGQFHPYTPLATGVIGRACLEYSCAAHYLLSRREGPAKAEAMYRIFEKGMRDYHWDKPGAFQGQDHAVEFRKWGKARGVKSNPVFNPANIAKEIVDLPCSPYRFLSDFTHGNPVLLSMSVLSAQEDFGVNLQKDYWALAISYSAALAVIESYLSQLPKAAVKEFTKEYKVLVRFHEVIKTQVELSWGPLKEIPDRDQNPI